MDLKTKRMKILLPLIIGLCLFSVGAYAIDTILGFSWTSTRVAPDSVYTTKPDIVIIDPQAYILIDVEWTGNMYADEPQDLIELIVTNENPEKEIDGITMYLYLSDDGGTTKFDMIQVTLTSSNMGGDLLYGETVSMIRPNNALYLDDPFVCPVSSTYTLYVEITGIVWQ